MTCKRFIAFDLGAESGRAIVGLLDKHNNKLSCEEIYRFANNPVEINGHLYWNVLSLYANLIEGLKVYALKFGDELDGIGIDTWGVDYGLLDKKGNLLSNPFHYRDAKNIGTDVIIEKCIGRKRLYELTGVQLMTINTVNQLVTMVRDESPLLPQASNILFIGDLLHYFLTGTKKVDYTMATISQLYNPLTNQWDKEIFDALGIPYELVTEISRPGEVVGMLNENLAAKTGLKPVPVIAPAVHDTASAAVAVPATKKQDWAFLSSGTWSILGVEVDKPIIDDNSCNLNISNSGGALGKTLYLKNVMGLWVLQCCKRLWEKKDPELTYETLTALAGSAEPFAAFIDPDDYIFLNPSDPVDAINLYLKKTGQISLDQNDLATITRVILEGLALKYRYVLEKLQESTDRRFEVLHIIGGGSKNTLLNRFTANALQIPVIAGPDEASAIGNIMIQSVGAGCYNTLQEIRNVVENSFQLKNYEPSGKESWDNAFIKFVQVLKN